MQKPSRMHFLALMGLLAASCGGASKAKSASPARVQSPSPTVAKSQSSEIPNSDRPGIAQSGSPKRANDVGPATTMIETSPPSKSESSADVVGTTQPGFQADSREEVDAKAEAKLHLVRGNNKAVGALSFVQRGNEVSLSGSFQNLPAGTRAIQIQAMGECNSAVARKSGQHFNPTKAKHGLPESAQRHVGDFGNIVIDKDGTATFSMKTDSLTVTADGPSSVLGRIVVITRRADDGKTQPDGNAGPAIACGVIN